MWQFAQAHGNRELADLLLLTVLPFPADTASRCARLRVFLEDHRHIGLADRATLGSVDAQQEHARPRVVAQAFTLAKFLGPRNDLLDGLLAVDVVARE